MTIALLDTGPLVAMLDRRDRNHDLCRRVFDEIVVPVVTTDAVVTEACHLLQRRTGDPVAAFLLLQESGIATCGLKEFPLGRIIQPMQKYSDAPMDYADATLVALAEAVGARRIFTLDRRHFLTYRLHDRQSFEVVP